MSPERDLAGFPSLNWWVPPLRILVMLCHSGTILRSVIFADVVPAFAILDLQYPSAVELFECSLTQIPGSSSLKKRFD